MNKPTTRYFYDGQMACEEDFAELVPNEDPFFEVTRYGLGARGVDWIEKATVEDTSISFPIYDGHGNVIAQLGRTGSSYSLTQVKSYDVWGGVRSGALGPPGRYCGNLGHVSDDESGLIYMRARYYEPGSGRFISEDPAMDGQNWFAYAAGSPATHVDPTGCAALEEFIRLLSDKYGEFKVLTEAPAFKILSGGAAAYAALILWAERAEGLSLSATGAGLGLPWMASVVPWLPAFLVSVGSVARVAAGGFRIAAAWVQMMTMIAFLVSWTADAE